MSCRYKYDNQEFNSKEQLAEYLKNKDVQVSFDSNNTIAELNSSFEDPVIYQSEIEKQVQELTDSLEQVSFFGKDSKTYAVINQKLLDEQAGTVKILRDSNGKEVEVDIAAEYEKYKKGQPIQQLEGLMEEIENHIADKAYSYVLNNMVGGNVQRQETLLAKLTNFASKLGISIQTMDNYMAQYQQRNGVPASVNALADMFNQVIAISNTGTVADFTEEIAHFAIEYFDGQEEISDMMDNVDKTTAYKTHAAQYRGLYAKQGLTGQALENKVRKEVIGKILAQKILDNFAQNETNLSERGIFSVLQRLFGQFLDLFAITDNNRQFFVEFGQTLDNIAQSVTDDSMFTNFDARQSKEVYYSATKEDTTLKNILHRTQKELEEKYRQILKGGEVNLKASRLKDLERVGNKLVENDYAGALKGYVDFLYLEVQKNDDQIEKAVADAESILRARRIAVNQDPEGFTEEELYREVARQLEVDTANLIIFNSDIEDTIAHLSNQVNLIKSRNPNLPVNYFRNLNKKIDVIRNRVRNTKDHTVPLARNSTISEMKNLLTNLGFRDEQIQEVINRINEGNEKDRNPIVKFFFSLSSHSNPVVGAIAFLLKKAHNKAQSKARDFGFKMTRLAEKLGVSQSDAKKLFEGTHMIAPWDVAKFERDFNKALNEAIEPIAQQINELDKTSPDYLEKRTKLENDFEVAKQKIREEWLESRFSNYNTNRVRERKSQNPITKQNTRTASAQKLIRELARNRIEITSKYRTGELMSARDQRALQTIVGKRKQYMSFYNPDGSIKDSEELAIAYDLRDYYNFEGGTGVGIDARDEFNLERERMRNLYGKDSVEYKRWLSQYAYLKYPDSYYEGTDFTTPIDEEETQNRLTQAGIKVSELRALVEGGNNMTLQEIFNALRDKKRQLIDPYRVRNKSGEVDGIAIERDSLLTASIAEVENYLKYFKILDEETDFVAEPNDAFRKKYFDLLKQNDPVALNQWLVKHGANKSNLVDGVPMPSTSYYKRYNSNSVQRDYEPTLQWQMEYEDSLELNSNYNEALRGKAMQPSMAKMKEYKNQRYFDLFGLSSNNPFDENVTRNKNLFEFRKFLLSEKYFMDKKVGQKYAYFQLPQVRAYFNENILSSSKGIGDRFRRVIEDAVVIDRLEDEFSIEQQRGDSFFQKGQKGVRVIPKFYTRLLPEEKQGELTEDVAYMFGKYAAMAYNYEEKGKIAPKVHAMRETLLSVTNKDSSLGEDRKISNTIHQVDEYLDTHMYGNVYKDMGGIMGKNGSYISVTKIINTANRLVRGKNLGLNTLVALTSPVVATLERRAMAFENKHLSHSSINFANQKLKMGADIVQMIGETASLKPDSLSKQLLENAGVAFDLNDVTIGGMDSRAGRALSQTNILYDLVGYKVMARMIASVTVLSVYDNYRMVDGAFINYKQFREASSGKQDSEIKKEWDTYRKNSYFNYLKKEDNRLVLDNDKLLNDGYTLDTDLLQDRMRIAAQEANDFVEGQVNFMDKNLLSKNPFLSIIFMIHRNYFQRFLENRFKAKGYNFTTGTEEEGHYRTVARLMLQNLEGENGNIDVGSVEFFKGLGQNMAYLISRGTLDKALDNGNLTETEKANLKRIQADFLVMYTSAFALFVLMNLVADGDEEDPIKQYMALVASRIFVETTSTRYNAIGGIQSTFDMFKSPSAGYTSLESLFAVGDLIFQGNETLQSGHYAGKTKGFKALMKSTPFKNVYEPLMGNPRSSNMFYRSRLIPHSSSRLYDLIEEQVNE